MSASSVTERFTTVRHLAETLAVAAAGGAALGLIGFPAGWLSGSILAVAGAALAGHPMLMPTLLMRAIFVLIGISLGAVVTPETLRGMATYPASIAVLIVAMAVISFAGAGYLRLIHRWGTVDAYLAAAPGGMSQVLALGAELGGDLRAIAIVQSIRVVVIAVGLPAGLSLLGLVGHAPPRVTGALSVAVLDELAIVVVVSTIAAILAYRIRFPGGLLFGAMLTSAVLHGSGLIHAVMPGWVANTVMVAMGAVWLTFCQYAAAVVAEFCRRRLWIVCRVGDNRGHFRGRADQRAVTACCRSDDRFCTRIGRRHDAAGARAQSGSGLCGCSPPYANLFRIFDHAAAGAEDGASPQS